MLPHSEVRDESFDIYNAFPNVTHTRCRMCSKSSPFVASIISGSINFSFGEPCLNYLDSALLFLFIWLFAHLKSLIAKLLQSGFQASHSFQWLHTPLQTKLFLNTSLCFLWMFCRRLGLKLASPVVICLSPAFVHLEFFHSVLLLPFTQTLGFLCPNTTIHLLL